MGGRGASSSITLLGFGHPPESSYDEFINKYDDGFDDVVVPNDIREDLASEELNKYSAFQAYLDDFNDYQKPEVLSDEVFDDYVRANGLETIYRGVKGQESITAEDMLNSFKYGEKYYTGQGCYGDGTYFGPHDVALSYSKSSDYDGAIMRSAIKRNAKIISYDALYAEMRSKYGKSVILHNNKISAYGRSRGYDVISAVDDYSGDTYFNVINRGALVISSSNTKNHRVDN